MEHNHSSDSAQDAPIRVLLADSQPVILEGLRNALSKSGDMQIAGEATDGLATLARAAELAPDVILMDVPLAEGGPLGVVMNLRVCAPRSKLIWFAPADRREEFVDAMRLGCSGVVYKHTPIDLILKSIRRVHAGEIWLDSATIAAIIRRLAVPEPAYAAAPMRTSLPEHRAQLSTRERQITMLITRGLKNKDIARKMLITEQTVKNHIHNIFEKLGVGDRLELALYAVHHNWHASEEAAASC
ncbi:MAG TPA: response regulator transcription factor [Bryobacteraceae bacterium]